MNSKLPHSGTTIFSVMTALANEHNAINLSQGFPDFPVDPELISLVNKAMQENHNQYAPMPGLSSLKKEISNLIFKSYNKIINPEKEITITSGATEALYAAISIVINHGDEVIMFDPAYDSYEPAVILNKGIPVRIPLTFPEFRINWGEVRNAINKKTKLIILNSPNNPAGTVISGDDIKMLKEIVSKNDLYILSDEVYENIIFDGKKHCSVISDDDLFKRALVVSSFGKTFHITGWKVGYCSAPEKLTAEFRKIHQFLTFSTSTPFQYALSGYLKKPGIISGLKDFYQIKRDYFLGLISDTKFKPLKCEGTYFQLLDYSDISDENDFDFAVRLTKEIKVATIPVSSFYKNKTDNKIIRICFAKENDTLSRAAEKLRKL